MTITEVLQIVDRLVFSQTGKHLDDLQESVIEGVWQGQTYQVIADDCQHSESRVRDVGHKLWGILSERLGENINKFNFFSTLKRLELTNIQSSDQVRFCSYSDRAINDNQKDKSTQQRCYCNLKQAPKINHCYGRETELSNLCKWIENPNTKLISIAGITGIGKSTLVRHFVDINTQPFDVTIWENLKMSQSLVHVITKILIDIPTNNNTLNTSNILNQFLDLLNKKRCLIILDNFEEIFTPQQFVGQYKPEDKESFLQIITEMGHQSCFLLISQEKCQEMVSSENELYPSYCLELSGLDESATQIFKNIGLKDEENLLKLINLYEGHPRYLQSISILIKDIFNNKVSDFLQEKSLILTEDIRSSLTDLYQRLSSIEKQIVWELSCHDQVRSKKDLEQSLSLSSMDLINGLQSLNRRYLIKTIAQDDISFNLSSVFREYVKNCGVVTKR
jgi:hypothetical protein